MLLPEELTCTGSTVVPKPDLVIIGNHFLPLGSKATQKYGNSPSLVETSVDQLSKSCVKIHVLLECVQIGTPSLAEGAIIWSSCY